MLGLTFSLNTKFFVDSKTEKWLYSITSPNSPYKNLTNQKKMHVRWILKNSENPGTEESVFLPYNSILYIY